MLRPCGAPWRFTVKQRVSPWRATFPPRSSSPSSSETQHHWLMRLWWWFLLSVFSFIFLMRLIYDDYLLVVLFSKNMFHLNNNQYRISAYECRFSSRVRSRCAILRFGRIADEAWEFWLFCFKTVFGQFFSTSVFVKEKGARRSISRVEDCVWKRWKHFKDSFQSERKD